MTTDRIYKICSAAEWAEAVTLGSYSGSNADHADGFIHFSTAAQVAETARRHFAGQSGLVLVAIDPAAVAADLKWEESRGGDLFPHLYAPLPTDAATRVHPLPIDGEGLHILPSDL